MCDTDNCGSAASDSVRRPHCTNTTSDCHDSPCVCNAECVDDILNDIESLGLHGELSARLLTVSENYRR